MDSRAFANGSANPPTSACMSAESVSYVGIYVAEYMSSIRRHICLRVYVLHVEYTSAYMSPTKAYTSCAMYPDNGMFASASAHTSKPLGARLLIIAITIAIAIINNSYYYSYCYYQ